MVGYISKSRRDFIGVYQEHLKESMVQKIYNQRTGYSKFKIKQLKQMLVCKTKVFIFTYNNMV